MAALPYIQLYVADYIADTMHLSTEEHGAYLLIIMNYWQTGKPLQCERIPNVVRMTKERFAEIEKTLSEFFTVTENGLWVHQRIEMDLAHVREKCEKSSESAKLRWQKKPAVDEVQDKKDDDNANAMQTDMQTQCHSDTDSNTDTDRDTKKRISIDIPKERQFKRPTIEQIKAEVKAKGYSVDPEKFFYHYEANGWKIGKASMKSWKAALVTWSKNEPKQKSNYPPPKQSMGAKVDDVMKKYYGNEPIKDAEVLG